MRPRIGVATLLVYRECPNGCWCATGEGAMAPRCGDHGEYMLPTGTPSEGESAFGSSWNEQRRLRGLGFRATLANEIALAGGEPIERAVNLALCVHCPDPPGPYFANDRLAQAASEIEAAKAEV